MRARAPQINGHGTAETPARLRRIAASHNLTDETYNRIVRVLGRQPTVRSPRSR